MFLRLIRRTLRKHGKHNYWDKSAVGQSDKSRYRSTAPWEALPTCCALPLLHGHGAALRKRPARMKQGKSHLGPRPQKIGRGGSQSARRDLPSCTQRCFAVLVNPRLMLIPPPPLLSFKKILWSLLPLPSALSLSGAVWGVGLWCG